ncbi:Ubiquitin-conjugating enzyme E2 Q2 [Sciurus carolinensis]|uniref:Ubiquitin-conjugating enzyme E2 Q2 n=1 Tax=Sciurus carolinensis TaxID=30640 RepID=A0AA41MV93_SCICA|nr:Ubiquitin-conjugating enzyme E2 Q2 [Sciurus carolinensis]
MSLSGLKTELKFLASIFDKKHERLHINSWKLDKLHCQFLHLDVEMLDQPLPTGQNGITEEVTSEEEEEEEMAEDIEDLDHYEMKEEEPISGKVRG